MYPEDMPALDASEYLVSSDGPDAFEQMVIELINRARLDPTGEAARYGTSVGDLATTVAVQILAPSPEMDRSATLHSQNMLDRDFFAHNDPDTETTMTQRIRAEGYGPGWTGENLSLIAGFADTHATQTMIEQHHENLWNSQGHQDVMLNSNFAEVGIGYEIGAFTWDGFTYPQTSVLTENFGSQGLYFLTGVVIDDADGDSFYDIGEGQSGVRITAYNDGVAVGTSTWDGGGYALALGAGTYTVVFEGGDLDGYFSTTVTMSGSANVKLDVIEGRDAQPIPAAAAPPVAEDPAEPQKDLITGTAGRDKLKGTGADEIFDGMGGSDNIVTGGGADEIHFGSVTDNGARDWTTLWDFDASTDVIALTAGTEITNHWYNGSDRLIMTVGPDNDRIVFKTDTRFEEIRFDTGADDLIA